MALAKSLAIWLAPLWKSEGQSLPRGAMNTEDGLDPSSILQRTEHVSSETRGGSTATLGSLGPQRAPLDPWELWAAASLTLDSNASRLPSPAAPAEAGAGRREG